MTIAFFARDENLGGPGRTDVDVGAPWRARGGGERLDTDKSCSMRGIYHRGLARLGAGVDPDVGDRGWRGAEEDQVAWLEGGSGWQVRPGVVLVLGYPGQADPGGPPCRLGQPGAVEAGAGVWPPQA